MSGASSPPPKTMSSRLLTMKFMQRAAASSPAPASPSSPDLPSPKRRKTESGSTPTKFDVDALADQRAIQAAMASEEAKRQIALEKQAKELGDTRWVLNFEDQTDIAGSEAMAIRVVATGFASLDHAGGRARKYKDSELDDEPPSYVAGRKSFGKFNRVVEKQNDPSTPDSGTSNADEDGEDGQSSIEDGSSKSDDPVNELIRASQTKAVDRIKAERRAKKIAEKMASEQMAKDRRKTEISLNGITSLSGRQEPPRNTIKCFNCGGPHIKAECPLLNKRRFDGGGGGGDDGPKRKAQRSY